MKEASLQRTCDSTTVVLTLTALVLLTVLILV